MQQGIQDIANQLLKMSDQLPTLKQCMADVQSGKYKPSDGAVVASGGTQAPRIDTTTGQPVSIIINDEGLINSDTLIHTPAPANSDDASGETADAETATVVAAEDANIAV